MTPVEPCRWPACTSDEYQDYAAKLMTWDELGRPEGQKPQPLPCGSDQCLNPNPCE